MEPNHRGIRRKLNYIIRTAEATDYPNVETLWLELNAHHVKADPSVIQSVTQYQSLESYESVLQDPNQEILLLCDGADVLGAAWLVERKHEGGQAIEMPIAFVQEFCTKQSERRRGLGRQLMQAVEQWARQRDLVRVELNVWAGNADAISFYESLDFGYARHELFKTVD